MKDYAGLDVSVKETSICIVDEAGRICREMKVVSHPEDLLAVLCDPAWQLERVGLEAGPLSQWLFSGLAEAGSPGDLHRNATREGVSQGAGQQKRSQRRARDRADDASWLIPTRANSDFQSKIAQQTTDIVLDRKSLFLEYLSSGEESPSFLACKRLDVGVVGFEQRIHDLVEGVPELADMREPLLAARRVLREKFAKLHRKVLLLARDNEVCQRLMTIPGVGPVVSLAFISTVDVPARFRNSKAVGPSLGLTPVLNQSGESHRIGRISLCGDEAMRALLYEAAQVDRQGPLRMPNASVIRLRRKSIR